MQQKDFHGRRTYASDLSDKSKQGFESRASIVIAWIKLQLARMSPSALTSVLSRPSRGLGEGFSLLGFDERHAQERELDTKVFPLARRPRNAVKAHGQVRSRE